MPTDIRYLERIEQPYQSLREVSVYGDDREDRLRDLPRDMNAFEKAVSSVANDIRQGNFINGG